MTIILGIVKETLYNMIVATIDHKNQQHEHVSMREKRKRADPLLSKSGTIDFTWNNPSLKSRWMHVVRRPGVNTKVGSASAIND